MFKDITAAVALSAFLLVPTQASETRAPETDVYVGEAQAIIKDFMGRLQGELQTALKDGGPQAAIGICQKAAPDVASYVSSAHGWTVRRTALKVRNPDNKPDAWERQVLEDFVQQAAHGADPMSLSAIRIEQTGASQTFRYMKAIPMAEQPCAVCHGTNVTADLRATVLELYPADEAVGFVPGDIRGAFTLSRTMD